MEMEPITRQEQIIAGKDLEPITRMERFLKEYGGASSWNDLKDKPFYTEMASVSVFENVEAGYEEGLNIWLVSATSQYIPTDGECVTLVWNGARHELILAYDSEIDDFRAPTEDGKATVSVWYDYDGGAWYWDVKSAELGTASLYITRETVHKIDAKYLPDGVGSVEPDMVITISHGLRTAINAKDVSITSGSVEGVSEKLWSGVPVDIRVRGFEVNGSYMAQAAEIKVTGYYYGGHLFVEWLFPNVSSITCVEIKFDMDGAVVEVTNRRVLTDA